MIDQDKFGSSRVFTAICTFCNIEKPLEASSFLRISTRNKGLGMEDI